FRVERIAGASELEEHFSRPSDFDLERYWAESSARFAETSRSENLVVTFAVEPSAIERLSAYWPVELIERRDGEAIVRVTLPGDEMAVYQAIAWADVARVLEPAALRDRAIARARQFVERNA
ncbi:MAG: WYL domain-containing protein, partial [Candidatus Eremiobacteraeota bacterium]|nr:WYL domain-containing protein [Candidatus Eremiobacteraeota bacterium]